MSTAVRPSAFTEPDRPKNLLIRFVTTGGSYVDVTGHGEHFDNNSWNCLGCGDASRSPEQDGLWRIRPDAACGASGRTPTPTPPPAAPSC